MWHKSCLNCFHKDVCKLEKTKSETSVGTTVIATDLQRSINGRIIENCADWLGWISTTHETPSKKGLFAVNENDGFYHLRSFIPPNNWGTEDGYFIAPAFWMNINYEA